MIRTNGHTPEISETRLAVVADVERLAPAVQRLFEPIPIMTAPDYLAGIAELSRGPTQGVVVGIEPGCRRIESAVTTLKQAAGGARLVVCCDPAWEPVGRRLLSAGADEYVLFPPTADDLERALQIPARKTRQRWAQESNHVPPAGFDELQRLADLLPVITGGSPTVLRDMAALVAAALRAESALVIVDGSIGSAGPGHDVLSHQATLIQDIHRDGRVVGQIRLGPSLGGAYNQHDTSKLAHYGALLGRLLDVVAQTSQWQTLAMHDDMTGLPNRRHLMTFLEDAIREAELGRSSVSVLLFDIDNFKIYNDRYGHDAGDVIIRETGQLFARCSRKDDFVSRYGGDEFVVVFRETEGPRRAGSQHPSEVVSVLNRFRKALSEHQFSHLGPGIAGCLTCSGGLARYPWEARTGPELIARADQALLEAKQAGKNRFRLVGNLDVCE